MVLPQIPNLTYVGMRDIQGEFIPPFKGAISQHCDITGHFSMYFNSSKLCVKT